MIGCGALVTKIWRLSCDQRNLGV
eukprot:SAG11_NODE_24704_length_369_cov_1.100000_1_plen_23_part_10